MPTRRRIYPCPRSIAAEAEFTQQTDIYEADIYVKERQRKILDSQLQRFLDGANPGIPSDEIQLTERAVNGQPVARLALRFGYLHGIHLARNLAAIVARGTVALQCRQIEPHMGGHKVALDFAAIAVFQPKIETSLQRCSPRRRCAQLHP